MEAARGQKLPYENTMRLCHTAADSVLKKTLREGGFFDSFEKPKTGPVLNFAWPASISK